MSTGIKRITKKRLGEFIDKVADVKGCNISGDSAPCYYSKIDGSYFTRVGMEDTFKMLLRKGIVEQLQNQNNIAEHTVNIGFNPVEKKWYGWSHRAIYGFGVGSICRKGHCHYQPFDKQDFREDCIRFWDDKNHVKTIGVEAKDEKGVLGVQVSWTYNDKVPNKKLRNNISGVFTRYPDSWGKGEWDAKTLEDAKQMAIDFAKGVS